MRDPITLIALICLLGFARTFAAAAGLDSTPLVHAFRVSGPDAVRTSHPSIGYLVNKDGLGFPTQRTSVSLAYDNDNLYVVFDCREEDMSKLAAAYSAHDDDLWKDDCVEVFIDTNHDHKTYYQVIANTVGAKYDARNNAGADSWNGEWQVSISKELDSWLAVVTIPFSSMSVDPPKPGTTWGIDFVRRQQSRTEVGFWRVIDADAHEPARYGHLVFGSEDSPAICAEPLKVQFPGTYKAQLTIVNRSKRTEKFAADLEIDGRVLMSERKSFPPGKSSWRFPFVYTAEGKHRCALTVRDSSGHVVMRTPYTSVDTPAHRARVSSYLKETNATRPSTAQAKQQKAALLRSIKHIAALAAQREQNAESWAQIGAELDKAARQLGNLRCACADTVSGGYALGRETSILKLRRDLPFSGDLASPLKISAARGEYEAAQLVIVPYAKSLKSVEVSVSDLRGSGKAAIPASAIQLNRVGYVKTRKPIYEIDYVGWYPDPLMDTAPFDVEKGIIQPVWVTVHPSAGTPAGLYSGKLTVTPANAPAQTVPLEVRVWDFDIPSTPHLKTAFALCEGQIGAWYNGLTPEIRRAYYDYMLEHRLNPTNIYSGIPMPVKDDLPYSVEHGLNAFNLGYIGADMNDAEREALLKRLKEYEAFLKEKGWWDKAYIYGFDEPQPDKTAAIKSMFGWIKQHFPDLPRMCTTVPSEELKGYIDIWCPILHGYNQDLAKQYEEAGDQVWWYVAWIPGHPYPNILMDYPAIDHRVLFWMNWKYKVPGFLYYAVNLWNTNSAPYEKQEGWYWPQEPDVFAGLKAGKRWPEIPWNTFTFSNCNGDGQLIYPGPNGKPIGSIRMEMIRDGIEDYEYFAILSERITQAEKSGKADPTLLAKARKLLVIDDSVVKTTSNYTKDPRVLLKARQHVAEMIERLGREL